MNSEREIIFRLFEYRKINLPDNSFIWRTADGICHMEADGVRKIISYDKYNDLRHRSAKSFGNYDYPYNEIRDLPRDVREDILDFEYHYEDMLRNSKGQTSSDTIYAFSKAIDFMKSEEACYSDVKVYLNSKEQNLISKRIENQSANEISKEMLGIK